VDCTNFVICSVSIIIPLNCYVFRRLTVQELRLALLEQ
jgi:hypothetical protein